LYKNDADKANFFTPFFDKLAGTDQLRKQIIAGKSEAEIRATWQEGLDQYRKKRMRYLMFADKTK
jgi:uncharacterized protein YbbC (DUF1343 family)